MLLFDGCTTYTFSVTRYSKARARSLLQHQRGRFIKDRKKKATTKQKRMSHSHVSLLLI